MPTITIAADPRYYPFGTVLTTPQFPGYFVVQDIGPAVTGFSHFDIASSGQMFPDYAQFRIVSLGDPNSAAMQRYFDTHGGTYQGPSSTTVNARTTTYFPGQGDPSVEGKFETFSGATPQLFGGADKPLFSWEPGSWNQQQIAAMLQGLPQFAQSPADVFAGTGIQPFDMFGTPAGAFQPPESLPQFAQSPADAFAGTGIQPFDMFGTPQGLWNPPTTEVMSPSPADQFSPGTLFNPPTNEFMQPSPVDQFSPGTFVNPPTNEAMQLSPVDQFSAPQNVPTNENMMPSPVDKFSDQISSPGTVTDNPFNDPFSGVSGEASQSSPGTVADNPFADQSWLPEQQQTPVSGGPAQSFDPLAQGSTGQPGGIQTVGGLFVDPNTGRISVFNPTTGGYTTQQGPGGWTNTGYGSGSAFGAGWAGPGGAGFGGFGGLGGSGAPSTISNTGINDSSVFQTAGVDPSGMPGGGPDKGVAVQEGATTGSDIMDYRVAKQLAARGFDPTTTLDARDAATNIGLAASAAYSAAHPPAPLSFADWLNASFGDFAFGGGQASNGKTLYQNYVNTFTPFPAIPPGTSPADAIALLTGTHG